ncbi:MAG: metallophosphoesterase family protein [Kofleriaceae bacterium]|nr:metallophosphoesterase family protein [Kofleriaceae bacterium]
MRRYLALLLLASCVKGNPETKDEEFNDSGGMLAVPNCSYSITTRIGAEAPAVATDKLGPDPTPRLVHLGLVGDPKTSMVVQWRTVDEVTEATEIRFGVGANLSESQLTETVTGITFGFRSTGMQIYQVHQAHLCGLMPGTTYSYQVGAPGHYSPIYSFRTAPDVAANPDTEVVFGFLGDSRDGYDIWAQLAELVQARQPDLILFSGDAVTVGLTQYEWEEFFGRGEQLLARVPLVSAHGNHEVNAVNYYAQLAMPGDQENFGIDYGHAHVTVANDSPDDIAKLTGEFRDAIEADFEASKNARWKLFMHHQPMWSASTRHGSSLTLQQAWMPLIDKYDVDLVLNGHDHDYEVSKPLINGVVQASNDGATVYVVAGGAGADLYGNGMGFWTEYSEKTYSGAIIRVRRDSMMMEAFRQDGTPIPTGFSKTKQ